MTSVINRVYKSRNSIRGIYQDYEWDTSTIPDFETSRFRSHVQCVFYLRT